MSSLTSIDPLINESGRLHEPTVQALDAANIVRYAEKIKRAPLTEKEKKDINAIVSSNSSIITLSGVINNFITLQENFSMYTGLAEEEKDKLNALLMKRKEIKDSIDKHEFDIKEYTTFVANEKKIVPLTKKMQYWSVNSDALKKLELWENIHALVKIEAEKNHENQDIEKTRLHKLGDIKDEWTSHQVFSKYSSIKLHTFYKDYICELEKYINDEAQSLEKHSVIISEYLYYLLVQIQELKKQAINSMLYRLHCAEYFNDLKCDDLLLYTTDKIDSQCNITTKGGGVKPTQRRGLTPDMIAEFLHAITEYCRSNPNEKSILENMNNLNMQSTPTQWKSLTQHKTKALVSDPILVYFANTVEILLEKIMAESNATNEILNAGSNCRTIFTLNKILELISTTKNQYTKIYKKNPVKNDNAIADMIIAAETKLASIIAELNISLGNEIKNLIDTAINSSFNNKDIATDLIKETTIKTKNYRFFNTNYAHSAYLPDCDIILALAIKIKTLMSKDKVMATENTTNIFNLLTACYPDMTENDKVALREQLNSFAILIPKLKNAHISELIHYLVHVIEWPLFTQDNLTISLGRHKHIAKLYAEPWEITPNHSETNSADLIISYIKNVVFKLIKISPIVTLDNFDNSELKIMLDNLENIILDKYKEKNKLAAEHNSILKTLKYTYEKSMLEKINDIFQIKSYLTSDSSQKINLLKLNELILRTKESFSDTENKKLLLKSINTCCFELLKSYILYSIENDKTPDIDFINKLNIIINENIFEKLCKDTDLRTVLKSYIEYYDGTKNNLTALLIGLTPGSNHCDCEKSLLKYATKRLDYLKSSLNINQDDYQFFFHYSATPSITNLLTLNANNLSKQIILLANAPNSTWNKHTALLIELLGDDNTLITYRFKRMKELLENNNQHPNTTESAEAAFQEFNSTINTHRPINSKQPRDNSALSKELNIHAYIDHAITNNAWSILLERIVTFSGSEQQLQNLHFQFLQNQITELSNFSTSWIGKQLIYADTQPKDAAINLLKQFFITFLGVENIKKLIAMLDLSLKEIMLAANSISAADYEKITKLIISIRPLTHFYTLFSDQSSTKNIFTNLTMINHHILLQHELYSVMKNQLDMLNLCQDYTSLQKVISDITLTIKSIEQKGMLNESSINAYLDYCDTHILDQFEKIISKNTYDFKSLSTLANFLFYVSSAYIKSLLLNTYKDQLSNNPYWLALINHLDEEHTINNIEHNIATSNFNIKNNADFIKILAFAKKLCKIKHLINQRMKLVIFQESDIKPINSSKIVLRELLSSSYLTDNQLIKLWSAYAIKLTAKNLYQGINASHIAALIKIICKISDAILLRSRDNPDLLAKITDQFKTVFDIYHSLQDILAHSPRNNSSLTIWSENIESDKLLQPVFSIIQKTCVMQLLACTEKYALEKIPKKNLPTFKIISNDPVFSITDTETKLDLPEITRSLGIKNDENTIKVVNALKIYHHLFEILNNNKPYSSLPTILDRFLKNAPKKNHFSLSSGYTAYLKELINLSSKCISAINDKKFPDKGIKKIHILSLLKLH